MQDTASRTRCSSCGKGLTFDEWSNEGRRCDTCLRAPRMDGPAATYVRGPAPGPLRHQIADEAEAYERLLDDLPDDLVDELVAMLEAEAERRDITIEPRPGPIQEVLADIGIGHSPREIQWAAWGFAAGFAANVLVAKYAQMESAAPMGQFIAPLLIGGVVAGIACSAIGWGLAKLRER